MSSPRREAERRLQQLLGLSPERAERAVEEVLDCLQLDVESYIEARHSELREQGVSNAEIYDQIAAELPALRFRVALSARQIRRRIYG